MARKKVNTMGTIFESPAIDLGQDRFVTISAIQARQLAEGGNYIPHQTVQRGLTISWVNKLLSGLDSTCNELGFAPFGAIYVFKAEDGSNYVFDGQHRVKAVTTALEQINEATQTAKDAKASYEAKLAELNKQRSHAEEKGLPFNWEMAAKSIKLPAKEPLDYQVDPNTVAMLDSPVFVITYAGKFVEAQLKELFCAANSGKAVQQNLVKAFALANETLMAAMTEAGWLGVYIEDKKGINAGLLGARDVINAVEKAGGTSDDIEHPATRAMLDYFKLFFDECQKVEDIEQNKLAVAGLNSAGFRFVRCTLGGSVRMLLAVSRLMAMAHESLYPAMVRELAEVVGWFLKPAAETNKYVPVYQLATTGFKLTSATVAERTIFWYLLVYLLKKEVLVPGDFDMFALPKRMMNQVESIENELTQFDYTPFGLGVVGVADALELLVACFRTPKVKQTKQHKLTHQKQLVERNEPGVDSDTEAELMALALDPDAIDL